MKNVIKKTGKIVSAPVRVPVKAIKRKHKEHKQKKALKKALDETTDAIKNVFTSKEFVEGMESIINSAKNTFNTASASAE